MPKGKIGTRADAGVKVEAKRFTNGHKTFTAAEAKSMTEQQTRERITLEVFEDNKSKYLRPRNPLAGEETPRSGEMMGQRKVDGFLLMPSDRVRPQTPPQHTMWAKRNRPKEATLKVGQIEEEEARTLVELSPHVPGSSPSAVREMKRVEAMRVLQDTMTAELDFLASKLNGRQQKISSSLISNMRTTLSEREDTRSALMGYGKAALPL